jgi:hypothetical protein
VRLPESSDTRVLLAGGVAFLALVVYLSVAFATTHASSAGASLGNPVAPWEPHASTLVKVPHGNKGGFAVQVIPAAKGSFGALASTLVANPPERRFVVGLWLRAPRPDPVAVTIDEFRPDANSVYLVNTTVQATGKWRHFTFRGRVKGTWLGLGMYVSRQAERGVRSRFELRGPTVAFLGGSSKP